MKRVPSRVAAGLASAGLGFALTILIIPAAQAHVVCGNRIFPVTLTMDDPGVGDELSLPTITYLPIPATDSTSAGHSLDYGFEIDKTITQDLGIAINEDYLARQGAGQNVKGWDNVTFTLKDELPCIEDHEFAMSVGIIHQFGRTGASQLLNAGIIDSVSNTAPTVYLGKGLGDLPIGYLRPLAVTGEAGYQFSDTPSLRPNQWVYATSVQYSMPYLQQHVKALELPDFVGRLIPLVEFSFTSPPHTPTTGTIAPGLFYEADSFQVGAEALIPANKATSSLQGTGFIVQFHLFLDDLFPDSIGRPLIDRNLWK